MSMDSAIHGGRTGNGHETEHGQGNGVAAAPAEQRMRACELSVVMPCLDEARTLGTCIGKAQEFMRVYGIEGEVVVADNGSTDGSQEIAQEMGARVVPIGERGYGAALRGGIEAASGEFIIMGDSDDSYDFSSLGPFVEKLREGYELVMGNRFAGGIRTRAMPVLHRYLGNPVLSWVGRLFFKSRCGDFYCGLRGFRREAWKRMDIQSTGMEFALEMLVKSTMFGLRVTEVPTTLSPDGRGREPHLRRWRDGWRSLRFYLLFSPRWLLGYPGLTAVLMGLLGLAWLMQGPRSVAGVGLDVHAMLYSAAAVVVGVQAVGLGVVVKALAVGSGLHPPSAGFQRLLSRATLEAGLVLGGVLMLMGSAASVALAVALGGSGGAVGQTWRLALPAALCAIVGAQVVVTSFCLAFVGFCCERMRR